MNRPSSLRQLFALWAEDWRSNGRDSTRPGFRALFVYRFGRWKQGIRFRPFRIPMTILYRFAFRYVRNVYGIELPLRAEVGRGVVFEHQGLLVIHSLAVIGDRCRLRHGTTLGMRSLSALDSAPRLGNDVDVGANVCILGAVVVGDRARIGAGSVVLEDVPADSVVVGNPARVVRGEASQRRNSAP